MRKTLIKLLGGVPKEERDDYVRYLECEARNKFRTVRIVPVMGSECVLYEPQYKELKIWKPYKDYSREINLILYGYEPNKRFKSYSVAKDFLEEYNQGATIFEEYIP